MNKRILPLFSIHNKPSRAEMKFLDRRVRITVIKKFQPPSSYEIGNLLIMIFLIKGWGLGEERMFRWRASSSQTARAEKREGCSCRCLLRLPLQFPRFNPWCESSYSFPSSPHFMGFFSPNYLHSTFPRFTPFPIPNVWCVYFFRISALCVQIVLMFRSQRGKARRIPVKRK